MANLINSIDFFEQEIIKCNAQYNDMMDMLKDYRIFISSLELNFSSKIVRTVSEDEINDILNSNKI